jgi:hypothetical protein
METARKVRSSCGVFHTWWVFDRTAKHFQISSDDTNTKLLLLSAETRKYWTIENVKLALDIPKANGVNWFNNQI